MVLRYLDISPGLLANFPGGGPTFLFVHSFEPSSPQRVYEISYLFSLPRQVIHGGIPNHLPHCRYFAAIYEPGYTALRKSGKAVTILLAQRFTVSLSPQ
jgi:hypothetical protein